jgi:hypothetical protein
MTCNGNVKRGLEFFGSEWAVSVAHNGIAPAYQHVLFSTDIPSQGSYPQNLVDQ